jgi:putative addiction module killer protein
MTEKTLILYQTQDGREPFQEWRADIKDKVTRARIDRRLEYLAQGNYGDHKAVGEGVFELRLFFGAGYRVYVAEDGEQIVVLLLGGDKRSQCKDISLARAYWQDYRTAKRTRASDKAAKTNKRKAG